MTPESWMLPEQEELGRKRAELEVKRLELADLEVVLATLEGDLAAFEREYLSRVGRYYAELDELLADVAERDVQLNPRHPGLSDIAKEAKDRAAASRHEVGHCGAVVEPQPSFQPSEELRRLYRDVARMVHPDLATDENQRRRRTDLMAKANAAYRSGDADALRAILLEWQSSPEAVEDRGIGGELVRVIRMIEQIKRAIREKRTRIAELKNSEVAVLMQRARTLGRQHRDLLAEMAQVVLERIESTRQAMRSP